MQYHQQCLLSYGEDPDLINILFSLLAYLSNYFLFLWPTQVACNRSVNEEHKQQIAYHSVAVLFLFDAMKVTSYTLIGICLHEGKTMAFENMTQWKHFPSHWLANRITALPWGTMGDSTGSPILPNRVLIKESHLLAPLAPATLQNSPATLLINVCWMSTFSVRRCCHHPDFKGCGKDRVLLPYFKARAPKPEQRHHSHLPSDLELLTLPK